MNYNGRIQCIQITHKQKKIKKINWLRLIIWYIGAVISFMPIFTDALAYLATKPSIDEAFFIKVCTKGDVLWILATFLVITLVEYYASSSKEENNVKKWIALVGVVVWGLCCSAWTLLKYFYPEGFSGTFVLVMCGIIGSIVLLICTALQLSFVEVSSVKESRGQP